MCVCMPVSVCDRDRRDQGVIQYLYWDGLQGGGREGGGSPARHGVRCQHTERGYPALLSTGVLTQLLELQLPSSLYLTFSPQTQPEDARLGGNRVSRLRPVCVTLCVCYE